MVTSSLSVRLSDVSTLENSQHIPFYDGPSALDGPRVSKRHREARKRRKPSIAVNRWPGRFGEFVVKYGVQRLAAALGVTQNAVYNWVEGRNGLNPRYARKIVEISATWSDPLALEDVFSHQEAMNAAGCGK